MSPAWRAAAVTAGTAIGTAIAAFFVAGAPDLRVRLLLAVPIALGAVIAFRLTGRSTEAAPGVPDVPTLQLALADAELERDAAREEARSAQLELKRRRQMAAERLDKTTRELREFAFAATHDLQEPLRKIRMFGDLLAEDERERLSEEGRDHLARMQKAANHLEALLNDVLDLHRPDHQPKAARIDLGALVAEVIDEHRLQIDRTQATVRVAPLATIEADRGQIERLLFHLIGNALKFHRADARPEVDVGGQYLERPADGMPCFALTVSDNGIGFEQRYVNRIFQLFQRLHTTEEFGGRGIGLTLCRRIAEAHDGAITAQSEPGQGSTFIVTLPLQRRAQTVPPRPMRDLDNLLPPEPRRPDS
ncbi:MAG: hypothetical protein KC620_04920 [Myxococcales bacterium]|nr:hypothetical protein [Myxococcales bacterium]